MAKIINRAERLQKRIMRRIYLVAAIRYALNPVFLKALIVGVFFWRSMSYVSYAHVLANSPSLSDIPSNVNFFTSAVMHTDGITVALLAGIAGLAAWIAVDLTRRKSHAWL